jgi:dienelactone hydrolase
MRSDRRFRALFVIVAVTVAGMAAAQPAGIRPSYDALRRAFHSRVGDVPGEHRAPPKPPRGVYELVKYAAPLGPNSAYVTPVHKDGKRRPAIVWIAGGFEWGIDAGAWEPAPRDNDQSARAFREAGMVELRPSLRGCNDNPGAREYFLGEVDDVLAAVDYLRRRPDVDPARVYVGGHSTGGTMALLVAASRPPVRAVFAFGPIDDVRRYGATGTGLDDIDFGEAAMRSPLASIGEVKVPTFVIEGDGRGNSDCFAPLRMVAQQNKAPVRFLLARGATHFTTLAPITELIAARVMREASGGAAFDLSEADLAAAVARR